MAIDHQHPLFHRTLKRFEKLNYRPSTRLQLRIASRTDEPIQCRRGRTKGCQRLASLATDTVQKFSFASSWWTCSSAVICFCDHNNHYKDQLLRHVTIQTCCFLVHSWCEYFATPGTSPPTFPLLGLTVVRVERGAEDG